MDRRSLATRPFRMTREQWHGLRAQRFFEARGADRTAALTPGTREQGEILKRPTRSDCKSDGTAFGGSNPPLPTTKSQLATTSRARGSTRSRADRSKCAPRRAATCAPLRAGGAGRLDSELRQPLLRSRACGAIGIPAGLRGAHAPLALTCRSCGRSSMVELQPSKLIAWVRFPSPAPTLLPRRARPAPLPCPARARTTRTPPEDSGPGKSRADSGTPAPSRPAIRGPCAPSTRIASLL